MLGLGLNLVKSPAVAVPPPVNTGAPVIAGDSSAPHPGDSFFCSTGTWTGGGIAYTYQWKQGSDDSNAVGSGNNSNVYTVDASDLGDTLYCQVTATNAGGFASADSNETGTVMVLAVKEIFTVDFTGKSGGDFVTAGAGKAFAYSDATNRIGVWYQTGTEAQPDLSGLGVTAYTQVTISDIDPPENLAAATVSAIGNTINGGVVTVEDAVAGARTDAADVNTGAVITVTQQGVNPS